MKDVTALKALLAKVKAGDWCTKLALNALPESHVNNTNDWVDPIGWASRAFHNGSLNAAKKLHEAVLPGWGWYASDIGEVKVYGSSDGPFYEGDATDPARAWLIAILKALISEAGQ
jgi:hypothetical protein